MTTNYAVATQSDIKYILLLTITLLTIPHLASIWTRLYRVCPEDFRKRSIKKPVVARDMFIS
jgi:hypothetical protein